MLKIKDNVDLKVLEKYGYNELRQIYIKVIPIYHTNNIRIIKIYKNSRAIKYDSGMHCNLKNIDYTSKKYIEDLIQDGLVEKVEDK